MWRLFFLEVTLRWTTLTYFFFLLSFYTFMKHFRKWPCRKSKDLGDMLWYKNLAILYLFNVHSWDYVDCSWNCFHCSNCFHIFNSLGFKERTSLFVSIPMVVFLWCMGVKCINWDARNDFTSVDCLCLAPLFIAE